VPVGICPVCGRKRYLGMETGVCFDCEFEQMKSNNKDAEATRAAEEQEVKQEMPSKRGVCKECGREMFIKGYGLCGTCYDRLKKEKRLPVKLTITVNFERCP